MKKYIIFCFAVAFLVPILTANSLEKQGKFSIHFGWYAVGNVFEIGEDHGFFELNSGLFCCIV